MINLCRSAVLTGLHDALAERKIDAVRLAVTAQLPPDVLHDPNELIPVSKASTFYQLAIAQGGQDIILEVAGKRRLSNLGPWGLAMKSSMTGREALKIGVEFSGFQNPLLQIDVIDQEDFITVHSVLKHANVANQKESLRYAREIHMGTLFRGLDEALGRFLVPHQVCFEHQRPAHVAAYSRLFRVVPEFDQPTTSITFARSDFDAPIPGARQEFASASLAYLRMSAAEQAMLRHPAFAAAHFVRTLLKTGTCTLDVVADRLGISKRVLTRELSAAGTRFEKICNDARLDALRVCFQDERAPRGNIAREVGFGSQAAFVRWVQRRYGLTPSELREWITGRDGEQLFGDLAGLST